LAPLAALFLVLAAGRTARADITGCSVSGGITFPDYDLVSKSSVAGTGTLQVTCTGTGSGANNLVTVELGTGSGSCMTRTMTKGVDTLEYNIYTTSGHASVWCGATTQSYSYTFGGGSEMHPFAMYGLTGAGQAVAPGVYSDPTIMASLTWPGGSTSGSFVVGQDAPATCGVSATDMSFGTYTGVAANATATLSITCSVGSPYSVSLSGGDHANGATRRMASPSLSYIGFGLFSDGARTTAWGDDTALGASVSGSGSGSTQVRTVYGQTIAGPLPDPGSYSDTVVVTVGY
jgi:spore coat protein U-like protein